MAQKMKGGDNDNLGATARQTENPFADLKAVEATCILGKHDGVMDDGLLDILLERQDSQSPKI